MVGAHKNMAEMMELYVDLINKYPFIIALIDPFRKEVSRLHLFLSYNVHFTRDKASSLTFHTV